MSRPSHYGLATRQRERLKEILNAAPPLREIHPQLAEVRIEFDFEDGTPRAPSSLAYSYFPAARGFFRYACPCYNCSGEFDLSEHVAALAEKPGGQKRQRKVSVSCNGQRMEEADVREACPICARIRLSAVLHDTEQNA